MKRSALLAFCALLGLSAPALAQITLTPSGPVTVTQNGQVVENLLITATGQDCVSINGLSNVIVRNVECRVSGGHGINASSAPGLTIDTVKIVNTATGVPLPSEQNCIDIFGGTGINITRLYVEGCSTGVYADRSPGIQVHFLEGHNMRGPVPRGQVFQANNSDTCLLEDFSIINDVDTNPDRVSWPEDNVSIYQSDGCVVRRGLADGGSSESGVGIMCEQTVECLVQDVDAIHQGNGGFAAFPGTDSTFQRTRTRDNSCNGLDGRPPPLSNGILWASEPSSVNTQILASQYFNACNPFAITWDDSTITVREITNATFTPRSPIVLQFPWTGTPPPTDTQGPSLAWVSPLANACLVKNSVTVLEANASDPSGVSIVRWYRDDEATAIRTDIAVPYRQTWTVSFAGGPGTHRLTVEATDTVGNFTEREITVRVVNKSNQC